MSLKTVDRLFALAFLRRRKQLSSIIYEKKDRIAYITLNRPEVLNAINTEMKKEINAAWNDFKNDPNVWVGIMSGAGNKAFSAGGDVTEVAGGYAAGTEMGEEYELLPFLDNEMWKPLIAAINGWCLGGGLDLALACDIRIATENSKLGLAEPKVGRIGSYPGIYKLSDQISYAAAMELILTGDRIDAHRAREIGLINQVVSSLEELMPAAEKMAERILACAPLAVKVSKELITRGAEMSVPDRLNLLLERKALINNSKDAEEGAKAFAEKRKPNWSGK